MDWVLVLNWVPVMASTHDIYIILKMCAQDDEQYNIVARVSKTIGYPNIFGSGYPLPKKRWLPAKSGIT